ncbi:hypothetical protein ACFOWE_29170 [Planomonospora corallina]|uniref:Secreted protein n=1 Tax=Planomonospora corallina TaxID=1806052 RepID=A0ABV8IE24_9ACTN
MFVLLVPVISVALLALLIMAPMWANDVKLEAMIGRFERYPLPPNTDWLEYGSPDASVTIRGNGNHCDYRARFTLRTSLTGPELTAHYDRADIKGIEGTSVAITVWMPEPSKRSAYYYEGFGSRAAIVEIADSTDSGWDLRCT